MSLMAGYDLIFELSNETVLKLIRKNLVFGGNALNPPFEMTLPLTGTAVGTAHLVVTGISVDLNANDTVTLHLPFKFMTINLTSPLQKNIGPLSGTINVDVSMTAGSSLTFQMNSANAAMVLDTTSSTELNGDLAGSGVPASLFLSLANSGLTSQIRAMPNPSFPLPFAVQAGTNGQLNPSIRFERLDVHCIPNADPKKQALGLFGILLVQNHNFGQHTQRTGTIISAANNGVAFSLSPTAFHTLVFAPMVAGIPTEGFTLNYLTDTFKSGYIDLNGKASKSGFCYDADAKLHGTVTMAASGTQIIPTVTLDEPDVEVDIPWYCYVVVGVILGPLGLLALGITDAALDGISVSLGNVGQGISGINFGSVGGVTFQSVQITPEGMTVQGSMPIYLADSYEKSSLTLSGSVITLEQVLIDQGEFSAKTLCDPVEHNYTYEEYQQQQRGTYALSSKLTSTPITPVFELRIAGVNYPLTAASGTVAAPGVTTRYAAPVSLGGTEVVQTVHVQYTVNGTQVTLRNSPTEGNFAVQLRAKANDQDGDPLRGLDGAILETWVTLQFQGDRVDSPEYSDAVQQCMHQIRDKIKEIVQKLKPKFDKEDLAPWPPVNYPRPDLVLEFFRDLASFGSHEADELLIQARIAQGSSTQRALTSEVAHVRTGKLEQIKPVLTAELLQVLAKEVDLGEVLKVLGDRINTIR